MPRARCLNFQQVLLPYCGGERKGIYLHILSLDSGSGRNQLARCMTMVPGLAHTEVWKLDIHRGHSCGVYSCWICLLGRGDVPFWVIWNWLIISRNQSGFKRNFKHGSHLYIKQCFVLRGGEREESCSCGGAVQQMKVIKGAIISIINMLDLLWPTE